MKLIKVILTGLKFWVVQNAIEIVVILVLGYLGVDVMSDFCKQCLFIENLEDTAWGIGIKTFIFLLPYLVVFTLISSISYFKSIENVLKYRVLNAVISSIIIILIGILKPTELKEMLLPFLSTLISSILIIIFVRFKATS